MAINLRQKLRLEADESTDDSMSVEGRLSMLQKSILTIHKRVLISKMTPAKGSAAQNSQSESGGGHTAMSEDAGQKSAENAVEERHAEAEAVSMSVEAPTAVNVASKLVSLTLQEHSRRETASADPQAATQASVPREDQERIAPLRQTSSSVMKANQFVSEMRISGRKRKALVHDSEGVYNTQPARAQCILHKFVAVFDPVLRAVPEWVDGPYKEFKDDSIRTCDGCNALCEWIFFLVSNAVPKRELCATCVAAEGFKHTAQLFMREGAVEYLTALDKVATCLVCKS